MIATPESEEEVKKTACALVVNTRKSPTIADVVDISRHAKLRKLLRVTAWVLRFTKNIRPGHEKIKGRLTREELIAAENEWLKAVQLDLKAQENFVHLVSELGLEEKDRVLRCTGRLANSDLEIDAQQPIILPRDHPYTAKVIDECHENVLHIGVRATLAEMRSRFWVPKGRQPVKKVLARCVVCKDKKVRLTAPLKPQHCQTSE